MYTIIVKHLLEHCRIRQVRNDKGQGQECTVLLSVYIKLAPIDLSIPERKACGPLILLYSDPVPAVIFIWIMWAFLCGLNANIMNVLSCCWMANAENGLWF